MFITRLLPCAVLFGSLFACSDEASLASNAATSTSTTTSGAATTSADTGMTGESEQAVYFSVDGALAVLDGDVDAANSRVNIALWNADLEEICTSSPATTSNVLGGTSLPIDDPELPLWGLWTLSLQIDLCSPAAPDTFDLGVGAYDPLLNPAVDAMGLTGDSLYGLYLSMPNQAATYVFGLAGTSEQFSGATPPVTSGPLPDGLYLLDGLHLIPVAP